MLLSEYQKSYEVEPQVELDQEGEFWALSLMLGMTCLWKPIWWMNSNYNLRNNWGVPLKLKELE